MWRGPDTLILEVGETVERLERAVIGIHRLSGIEDTGDFEGVTASAMDGYLTDITDCLCEPTNANSNLQYYVAHCGDFDDTPTDQLMILTQCLLDLGHALHQQYKQLGIYAKPNEGGTIPYYLAERKGPDGLLFRHE